MRDRRRERHVRRHHAGQVPLDDGPQRGRDGLLARRRQAADQGGQRRHHRHRREREEHRAPAGPDQRQLVRSTSKVSIDGTDDYLQAGLVAYSGNSAWGKLVVMRRPGGEWTTELGRNNGYQNGPALPANAQKAITLQLYARDGQLRGRYSLDDGTTWTEVGDGFDPAGWARRASASPPTTARVPRPARSRRSPSVRRPSCRPHRRARPRSPLRRATRRCSTAPTRRWSTGSTPAAVASSARTARSSPSVGSA